MPKIYTDSPTKAKANSKALAASADSKKDAGCVKCHEDYAKQRISKEVGYTSIQKAADAYKKNVVEPLKKTHPDIKMGDYHVVPTKELKAMLKAHPKADFIYVHHGLRDGKDDKGKKISYPVNIMVPVEKQKKGKKVSYAASRHSKALFLETLPCPPNTNCPPPAN